MTLKESAQRLWCGAPRRAYPGWRIWAAGNRPIERRRRRLGNGEAIARRRRDSEFGVTPTSLEAAISVGMVQ